MPLAWLLAMNAIVVALFGVVALIFPGPLFDAFGGTSDVGSQFVVQLFGAALVGEALLRFFLATSRREARATCSPPRCSASTC